jgi:hypothetical protein
LTAATVWASGDPTRGINERVKGAAKVVTATVTSVQSEFGTNHYGDRLILSHVTFNVEETMKGAHERAVTVTLEGGTVGDLTLEVSDVPLMKKGERAVLFLASSPARGTISYRRGAGILKLEHDRVAGTDLTVHDIRAAVKAAQAQRK